MSESGAFCTCGSYDLESKTRGGWTLREVVYEDRQEPGLQYSTNEVLAGHSYPTYVSKTGEPRVLRQAVFVLEKSRDKELDDARVNLAASERRIADLITQASESKKAAKEAADKVVSLMTDLKCERDASAALRTELQRTREVKLRLENDIGKLRKEIGEARFRQITSPSESDPR